MAAKKAVKKKAAATKVATPRRAEVGPVLIPKTISAAQRQLGELGALVYATEWHRAAILAAFVTVTEGQGKRTDRLLSSGKLTAVQFAELGIVGLRSPVTVARYVEAWNAAVDNGKAKPVKPGQRVALPDLDWPYEPKNLREARKRDPEKAAAYERAAKDAGVSANTVVQVANTPAAVRAAILADPNVAKVASTALNDQVLSSPEFKERVAKMNVEKAAEKEQKERSEESIFTHSAMAAISRLADMRAWGKLRQIAEFLNGVLEAAEATELTPEMFHE
jgi:hypothetical protein